NILMGFKPLLLFGTRMPKREKSNFYIKKKKNEFNCCGINCCPCSYGFALRIGTDILKRNL
ncbi:MAG: hypothetical protein ABI855_17150, partial [Bacteroidota bacterium]